MNIQEYRSIPRIIGFWYEQYLREGGCYNEAASYQMWGLIQGLTYFSTEQEDIKLFRLQSALFQAALWEV